MSSKKKIFGCVPSVIDGTENIYEGNDKIVLPDSYSYLTYLPPVINQGSRPICVPCSVSAYVNYAINSKQARNGIDNGIDLNMLFTGDKEGMAVKDCLSNLKRTGSTTNEGTFYIDNYARIGNIDALKTAIVANGPCIGAIGVYNSLISDFWTPTSGNFEGGHAISIVGYDKDGFIIRNSWGRSYGKEGYWHIPYEDTNLFYELWTIIK